MWDLDNTPLPGGLPFLAGMTRARLGRVVPGPVYRGLCAFPSQSPIACTVQGCAASERVTTLDANGRTRAKRILCLIDYAGARNSVTD
jgi:hypothetical protein